MKNTPLKTPLGVSCFSLVPTLSALADGNVSVYITNILPYKNQIPKTPLGVSLVPTLSALADGNVSVCITNILPYKNQISKTPLGVSRL
jgi:hypothetical protein